jgi:hypothetical protein
MNTEILIKTRERKLVEELNSMPKTQLVLNAGATSKMLNKVNDHNELRKSDSLISKKNLKLVRSTKGMYARCNNNFAGIFEVVRLSKKMKKEKEMRQRRIELGMLSSATLNSSMGSPKQGL